MPCAFWCPQTPTTSEPPLPAQREILTLPWGGAKPSRIWPYGRCAGLGHGVPVALRSGADSFAFVSTAGPPYYWPRFSYPPWRGPPLWALEALREICGGATIPTPGGAGTSRKTSSPVLGAPASIMGSELPRPPSYGAPVLRFAPPRCLKPSSAQPPVAGA